MIEIGADQIDVRHRSRVAALRVPRRIRDDGLDLALDALGELLAFAREHLDAVVLVRIVRRRDDYSRVVAVRTREIRHGRRGNDAGARDRRAFPARAVRQLALDPRARFARVAADQQPGPFRGIRPLAARRHRAHERCAQPPDGRRIERVTAGDAADAVGAEQLRNGGFAIGHD